MEINNNLRQTKRSKYEEIIFLIWLIIFIITFNTSFREYKIPLIGVISGNSMSPTLKNNDIVINSYLKAKLKKIERGDIVTVDISNIFIENDINFMFICKRIIGLPGETITIKEGSIFIDGEYLVENYAYDVYKGPEEFLKWELKEDEYFVMGDNRGRGMSCDSRYFGPINSENIIAVSNFKLSIEIKLLNNKKDYPVKE